MNNIVETHINKTQKRLKKYASIILKSKYDRVICDELVTTYINARYFNFGVDEGENVFYKRIFETLKKKSAQLINKFPEDQETIENTLILFQYFFYFDFVRKNIDIKEVISKISEKRKTKFNLRLQEDEDFENKFYELVREDIRDVEELLKAYDSNDFELVTNKVVQSNNNIYKVKLKYSINFPEIFNKQTIEETFNTDIISEDKLFVEYPMLAIHTLKDILIGNFKRMYIAEFSVSILSKKKKLEQLLNILENQAVQDKICFEITYDDFISKREEIYKIIKRGFNFILRTDSQMPELKKQDLKMLDIFNYIIVDNKDVNKLKYNKEKIIEV